MPRTTYESNPQLTAIAIAYKNGKLIADEVLPRVQVGKKQEFSYTEYNLADGFTVPDTTVGRTSGVNEVEFGGTKKTAATEDYGLEAPIPQSDIDNVPEIDVLGRAAEKTTDLILLDREVRAAKLVFNKKSYDADNAKTLSGTEQWSHADSRPIVDITNALDTLIMRPNVATFGRRVATLLRQNPSIVKAYNGTLGDSGMVPLEFLRDLLELDEILIGESRVNIKKPGKSPVLARVWGNHASFTYRSRFITATDDVTWGITAQTNTRFSSSRHDPDIGLRGGERVRVGETVKELILAKSLGYFFENAVAG